MIWSIFSTFLLIGFVSFGGGYAMLPVIEMRVTEMGWMSTQEFTDIIAVAGMAPGPIGTNAAIMVGFNIYGLPGAIAAAGGMVLPSFIIIMFFATTLGKVHSSKYVINGFYGLRPVITALIIYAAVKFTQINNIFDNVLSIDNMILIAIFFASFLALGKFKIHPMIVILSSGILGVLIF